MLALSAIVGFVPVWSRIPASATCLVLIGALLYLAGTIFYLWERLRFHSAIWHCFVLAGAACHYLAILDCTAS